MLTTVEGVYENGEIRLLEPLAGIFRARVVVTVLPDSMVSFQDPLDQPLTPGERAIWDEFPRFRAEHPVRFQSLTDAVDGRDDDGSTAK